jgi:aminoglycoside phosphotransferase (APT) family kinase protein
MGNGPGALVAEVNEREGLGLVHVGEAAHGESGGAVFVRWPDGREGVITRASASIEQLQSTADVLSTIRSGGLPVPRHDRLVQLAEGDVAVLQERLPGAPPNRVTAAVIDSMVEMNNRFADLLKDRHDVAIPPLYLRRSGPVFPRHETLDGYSDRSRRMLRLIHEVGNVEPHEMIGDDLVHTDYTVPNVLFDETGQISGIVDWNLGVARGDRRFALVKLRFDLTWDAMSADGGQQCVEQEAIDRVDDVLETTLEPDLLRKYWAHWTLVMLHWTIRSGNPEVIDLHLRLGESRLS